MQGMLPVLLADARSVQCARAKSFRLIAAVFFILLGLTVPAAAQASKRLILKDGSWQEVMKYEVAGDRTRYLSTLRREWEEVATDLVDWKATEEWNERPFQMPPDEEEKTGSGVDAADQLTVAPGLQLPTSGGVFLLDTFSGQPSLVELIQVPGVLNRGTSGIFHSAIIPGNASKLRLELKGSHARTQAHVSLPQLFVRVAASDEAGQITSSDRFRIVRLEPKKDSRVLANVSVTMAGKQSDTLQPFVPVRVEGFHEGWLKVVPLADLEPGEYALVEMLGRSRFNSDAWDFGVDPHAPGNPNAREADWAPSDEKSTFSPELKQRNK
jgi:hypothetical protein